MSKLKKDFYRRDDVVQISKELLGKYLFTKLDDIVTAGIITETEAYAGITDKASHAWNGRRTSRTEIMYSEGGVAYVYLCYGIHHLFNIVTNKKDVPHAVLIRAIKPVEGIPCILKRRNKTNIDKSTAGGPGTASQALGLLTKHSGTDLTGNKIWIEDKGIRTKEKEITVGPRVGIDYAGEDAGLPYRFIYNINY
ncbi:MAG: DNA-3-methyladenine glycosylase [Bacteroidetes bacterium]|nr:DNA-3-methyladenine glycosylase [Bacteroidota bacterium]